MMRQGCTARASGTLSGGADTHVGRAGERPRQLHHHPLLRAPHRTQQLESARLAPQQGLVQLAVRPVQLHRRHVPEPRGRVPANATYHEYDVYPRPRGAPRDGYRIVVNRSVKETWLTPDHYVTFYKL
jgi:hypothetical protein